MKKAIDTVTGGAALIEETANNWVGRGKGSIFAATTRRAKKLSNDPIFNAAAYMKYSFGPCLSGEQDEDWLESAKWILSFNKREN